MPSTRETSDIPSIPDHDLVRLIGRGSYGEIWLGKSLTGPWRAIKIVRRDRFEDETTYLREFRGITRFEPISREDSHFVDILHVGRSTAPDFFYFVMELADDSAGAGEINPKSYVACTLSRRLKLAKRYTAKQAIHLGMQLARGLEALHRHGLIHRDIKPSNIIFIRDQPKLADLGLVTIAGEGSFVGTEGFVAPEGPFTARADIYSLGKVLYEAVSGKDRLDFPELPTAWSNDPDDKPLGGLNRIILRSCAEDPKLRYQGAAEMAQALEALAEGREIRPPLVNWMRVAAIVAPFALATWWCSQPILVPLAEVAEEAVFATSEPAGAEVLRDGKTIGATPLTLRRKKGEPLDVQLQLEGWELQPMRFDGDTRNLHATFATGELVLSTNPPAATTIIDDSAPRPTPLSLQGVRPGIKKIRVQKAGYLSVTTSAEIRPRETTRIDLELTPADRPRNEKPWTNTLGMRFVPVDGLYVSVWETRVGDFEKFVQAAEYSSMGPMQTVRTSGQGFYGASWKAPGFTQDANHPVCGVSWKDAQAFCAWLTEQEREAGILFADEFYRLPTDREWSQFAGLPREPEETPELRDGKVKSVYPWPGTFPPPIGKAGNYAGEEMRGAEWPATWRVIANYRDPFTRTAPVGSFPPNSANLHDLGGNLWEWCVDKFAATGDTRVLRGASWANVESGLLLSAARTNDMIDSRNDVYGFRCILDLSPISKLDCQSEPAGAEVWIDGERKGVTPLVVESIRPGEIQVDIRKPGYLSAHSSYSIRPRSSEKVRVQLTPQPLPDFKEVWTNSLGMRFTPLDGLLFSRWETRAADYAAFVKETKREATLPDFAQTPNDPAVLVSRDDAEAFCTWLTEHEQDEGYIAKDMRYRLPTDAEWSAAVGIQEKEKTPHARDSKVQNAYPWGNWPPGKKDGNFGTPAADGFKQTAPVGSFAENTAGLFDLGGNVWEWCSDNYGGAGTFARWGVLRGGSWSTFGPRVLLSSYRNVVMPADRDVIYGFRCVLERTATP